jgi:hypothetical protein
VVQETGVLTGRRRAVDSTILADAVATQDTITQLIAAIRRAGRVVPGAAGQIAELCTAHDYSGPGKPQIDWDDPQAKDALVSALVNDAHALLAVLDGRDLDESGASALGLLALVAGQDVEPAEGSDGTDGRWRIARKVARDRVISVVDPDARHTRKSPENRRDGYRAHVAACPETGIITGEELTRAAGEENSDAAVATALLATGDSPAEVYGDSAYGTGDLRAALEEAGHTAVIKPRPLKPAVEGGFTLDDFSVDEAAGTVACPAGVIRRISARRIVTFGAACRGCPLRSRCTADKHGRALNLHPRDALLRAARHDWAARPGLREDYKKFRPQHRTGHLPGRQPGWAAPQTPLPRHRPQQRLAQEPHRRPQPAQPHCPWPGPPERNLGTGLTAWHPSPGPLGQPARPARLAETARATTQPTPGGLAYCRIDGLAAALPHPDHPLFRALLAGPGLVRSVGLELELQKPDPRCLDLDGVDGVSREVARRLHLPQQFDGRLRVEVGGIALELGLSGDPVLAEPVAEVRRVAVAPAKRQKPLWPVKHGSVAGEARSARSAACTLFCAHQGRVVVLGHRGVLQQNEASLSLVDDGLPRQLGHQSDLRIGQTVPNSLASGPHGSSDPPSNRYGGPMPDPWGKAWRRTGRS